MRLIDHMCKHELPIPQAISPAFGKLLRDMNRIDPADRLQSAAAVISRISEIRSRARPSPRPPEGARHASSPVAAGAVSSGSTENALGSRTDARTAATTRG